MEVVLKTKLFTSFLGIQKFWQAIGITIFFCSAIIACGGGGGSGSPASTAQYTGVTTPAALTTENSSTLVAESYQGAMTSDSMVPFAAIASAGQGSDHASLSTPIALDMQAAFADSLYQAIHASQEAQASTAERAVSESSTINGDCGGTATYNVTYDENSGVFSGSFVYNGFCSETINLSGQATFSGRMDSTNGGFDYFSLTFSNLTTTADGQSNTVNGTLECDFQGSDLLITTNMVVAQSSSGLVCWLNNYTVQLNGNQMEISGRYYNPIHGYIDFVTTSPLILSDFSQFPSAGVIEFTGAVGTGGLQTTAQLTALSSTTCQVTADTDGDGIDDFDTGEILWTEL
jgi:hypothetical protein